VSAGAIGYSYPMPVTRVEPAAWSWAKTAIGFRPEFLDFSRGIRVGNLEPHERITRILKGALETRYRQEFVTERWGRGVYWQWIGFLNRANRSAKPLSSAISFGCSKFYVSMDTEERRFTCGMQVERGYVRASREQRDVKLRSDWDWHRLVAGLTPRADLYRELKRLASEEQFEVSLGSWSDARVFGGGAAAEEEHSPSKVRNLPGPSRLRSVVEQAPANEWCGAQVYFPLSESDVLSMTGVDLIETLMAVFEEVRPAMNACMQVGV
jgi:hypothetical protein